VLPAQVQRVELLRAVDEVFLEVVLLQVDHARALVAGLGQQVEAEHLAFAVEGAADVPGHALVDHALANAQAVQDLQRALGVAHAARADRDGVVVVEQDRRQPALRRVDAGGQAHRPPTDDDRGTRARAAPGPPISGRRAGGA
jgi:hypothetical protein